MPEDFNRAKDALTRAAYRALLGRDPDEQAAAGLVSAPFAPDQEQELAALLQTFVNSDEFRELFFRTHPVPPSARPRPDHSAFSELHRDIAALRQGVNALERFLPSVLGQVCDPLEAYAGYYERWIRNAPSSDAADRPVAVLLDADDVGLGPLEDAVWSLAEQSHTDFRVVIGVGRADLAGAIDLMRRVRGSSRLSLSYVALEDNPDWRARVAVDNIEVVVLARADAVLHPHALRWLDHGLATDETIGCLYGDEDSLAGDDSLDWRLRPHGAPRLKPGFDEDLLLQTPYVGDLLAFSAAAWALGLKAPPASLSEARLEAPLRALELGTGGQYRCAHLPQILGSRFPGACLPDVRTWNRRIADQLAATAEVAPHVNTLGAALPEANRILWTPPQPASAAVIIPTRDRRDLLEPCVDSVLATTAEGRTRVRLDIIDHESREKSTRAYLARLAKRDDVVVRPYAGPFNWALMNNLAAHEAAEDVLVFLNNDTVALSPDWLDELVGQAMRPDVGVVGARLVYGEGDIQHAGFLALDHPDRFLTHDGLEDPGDAPGYLGRNLLVHRSVAVTGACMAVRRDVFVRLGGFDAARFHVEGNDVDLCFKAAAAGLKVLYTPHAVLRHFESRTREINSADARQMSREAARRLWNRWGATVCPDPWYNPRFDRLSPHFSRLRPI